MDRDTDTGKLGEGDKLQQMMINYIPCHVSSCLAGFPTGRCSWRLGRGRHGHKKQISPTKRPEPPRPRQSGNSFTRASRQENTAKKGSQESLTSTGTPSSLLSTVERGYNETRARGTYQRHDPPHCKTRLPIMMAARKLEASFWILWLHRALLRSTPDQRGPR